MLVAILVIGYVLVPRYLDQKNRERDRIKAGAIIVGPADYDTLKRSLDEMSVRLTGLEKQCSELLVRSGGARRLPFWPSATVSGCISYSSSSACFPSLLRGKSFVEWPALSGFW